MPRRPDSSSSPDWAGNDQHPLNGQLLVGQEQDLWRPAETDAVPSHSMEDSRKKPGYGVDSDEGDRKEQANDGAAMEVDKTGTDGAAMAAERVASGKQVAEQAGAKEATAAGRQKHGKHPCQQDEHSRILWRQARHSRGLGQQARH